MCQLRVIVQQNGQEKTVMESVTGVEVLDDGVVLTTFFEDPMTLEGMRVKKIDFLGGALFLAPVTGNPESGEE